MRRRVILVMTTSETLPCYYPNLESRPHAGAISFRDMLAESQRLAPAKRFRAAHSRGQNRLSAGDASVYQHEINAEMTESSSSWFIATLLLTRTLHITTPAVMAVCIGLSVSGDLGDPVCNRAQIGSRTKRLSERGARPKWGLFGVHAVI